MMNESAVNFFARKPEGESQTVFRNITIATGVFILVLAFLMPRLSLNHRAAQSILSILLCGVIIAIVVNLYYRLVYSSFKESTARRMEVAKSEWKNGSVVVDDFTYLNEKHRDDPVEIRKRRIYRIAHEYFHEGETAAQKKFNAMPNAQMGLKAGLWALMVVGAATYAWGIGLPLLFSAVGLLIALSRQHQQVVSMHGEAFSISRQWRHDFHNKKQNERIYNLKGWADEATCQKAFPKPEGVYVGDGRYFWSGQGHILTVGSNRAGKGTNLLIPCLLSTGFTESGTSFICLDPKGENAAITSDNSQKEGYDVHILNPFGIQDLPNSRFNPFDYVDKDDHSVVEYCEMLSEMIIPMRATVDANTEHFEAQARTILSCYMLHMIDVVPKAERNFGTLFKWSNYGGDKLDNLFKDIIVSDSYKGIHATLVEGFSETKFSGGEKEVSGVLSTLKKGMAPFMNPKLQDATSTSDFDLREVAQRKTGIYVCIPQTEMEKYSVWLRLVMGCSIKLLQKHYNKERKVVFILDEFPTLGYMKEFESNAGYMAGFNVTFWVVLQLLPQLQNLYPKIWETFVSNAVIKQFIGIGDHTTADYVSKLLPMDVVFNHRGQVEKEKRLLEADEVMAFPHIIVKHNAFEQPMAFAKWPYYEIEGCVERAKPRPLL